SVAGPRPVQGAGALFRRACARAHQRKRDRDAPGCKVTRHCERSNPEAGLLRRCAPRNDETYAACATALPLKVSPALPAETETFPPSLMRREEMSSDSGSCTDF